MTKRMFFGLAAVSAFLIGSAGMPCRTLAQELIAPPTPIDATTQPTRIENLAVDNGASSHSTRQFWLSGDFAFSFMRGVQLPPLATSSPAGTPRAIAGINASPSTETLFGGWQNDDLRAGFRLAGGWWFGGESHFGIEAGFVYCGGQTSSFFGGSDVFPILARPIFDANATNQAVLVSFPGVSAGTLDIRASAGNFVSASFDITEKAIDEPGFRIIGLVGYRYYRYNDSLNFHQNVTVTDTNFIVGTQVITNDAFTANNQFHGFDMGFRTQHIWGNLTLELLAKLAVGDLRRQIVIAGDQTTLVPGAAPVVDNAGVLALATNSGTFISHDWKVLPEAGVTLGWQLRPNLNVRVGYSFLLLNGISRSAEQVDTTVNPNFFPPPIGGGPNRPEFSLSRVDMWIQSVNIGVLWTY